MAERAARIAWLTGHAYAHRGLHGPGLAENSLAAARAAVDRGLGIECDVQLSADLRAMVFHDWDLDRLTDGRGPVAGRTAKDLGAIALAGGEGTIPTLGALLGVVAGCVPLLIEVKSRRGRPVAPACAAIAGELASYRGPHAVMSFDPRVGRWFARHSPDTVRGLVVTQEHDKGWYGDIKRRASFWWSRADFVALDVRDLPSPLSSALRRKGVPVLTWTVRSTELARRAALHADAPIAEGAGLS